MDSSRRTLNQSAAAAAPAPIPFTRKPQGSKKLLDDIVVGLDDVVGLIRDKLVEDQNKVVVVSIVGVLAKGAWSKEFWEKASLLCCRYLRLLSDDIAKYFRSFVLLRVLDLERCVLDDFPKGMELLVHLRSLTYLEKLDVSGGDIRMKPTVHDVPKGFGKNPITFPATLKVLTLSYCCLPWSDISLIQSLPNLQDLNLEANAFKGSCWNTDEQGFPQLKFLRLERLDIQLWKAYSTSFPCLSQLEVFECKDLEEIPLEIRDIPMLELIQIYKCRHAVDECVNRIQEEQNDLGTTT
ncbi:hypothetical protein L1987_38208 [Smallanthus sonchifolius]|uniref:Uncharacterized protein n=1 Tax=Smallanthus sonchifolius TaxID=185202 RepID=A0ACB9HJG2_9ASTR|nr:hypothetical protein L1987_38208 [Smallanthus sonchifolius]